MHFLCFFCNAELLGRIEIYEEDKGIYIGDVRFQHCPVFELNYETGYFEMLEDKEIKYKKECVEEDSDFLIFEVENDVARIIKS